LASDKIQNFYNPVDVRFGQGSLYELSELTSESTHMLLVTTPGFSRRGLTEKITEMLSDKEITVVDDVQPNPDLDYLEDKFSNLQYKNIESIIALGGGSSLDAAKVLSYLLSYPIPLRDYLQEGRKVPEEQPLPLIAIPTTAGTGSEVTPFATVWDMQNYKKYSLAAGSLFPQIALLDPSLTVTLPEDVTVTTGLDALSHSLEAIWNRNHNPVSTACAIRSVYLVLNTLPYLKRDLENGQYRGYMLEASLLGGLAISSTRTALAHSMSYPITARYEVPHGLACGFTLPAILEVNSRIAPNYFGELISALGCNSVEELIQTIKEFFEELKVEERLFSYIEDSEELLKIIPEMFTPGRADNNLGEVNESLLKEVIVNSFGN